MEIKQIKKRDGSLQSFDIVKIEHAILMALKETGEGEASDAAKVAQKVHDNTISMCVQAGTAPTDDPRSQKCIGGFPTVEEIQDIVEASLMELTYLI